MAEVAQRPRSRPPRRTAVSSRTPPTASSPPWAPRPTGQGFEAILEDLRGLWFDTALSGSASALPSLPAFAHPDRVLFGTDQLFAPELAVTHFTGEYDRHPASTP
ncbi:hypothetical protein OG762_39080 [Streptomyces sp. NBC_01136]|uniref:hypothetical protein n=1 Tax=unclassified Streptomyces TaxID=2593676 RepID=UPI003244BEE9|nr:hypothetical protein OG762_39080 [Streptomyces sp. NBC_01136]